MSHEEIMTSNMEQINQERQMRLRKKLAVAVDCFVNGGKKTKNGKGGMFEFSLKLVQGRTDGCWERGDKHVNQCISHESLLSE